MIFGSCGFDSRLRHMELNKTVGKEYDLPCQLCDHETTHKVLASAQTLESTEDITVFEEFQLVQCLGCKRISFRSNWQSDDDVSHIPTKREDGSQDYEVIYDDHEELFPSRIVGRRLLRNKHLLPNDIQKIYTETYAALCNKQPILAGIGIRTIVEAVCKDKKTKGKNLEAKIDNLVTLDYLTKRGADGLHGTRLLGNTSAHEIVALPEKNLDIGMDIVENLLLNVYILPHKAESLPKRKK
jgi:hypothetical protein